MKILIADDNRERASGLAGHLVGRGSERSDIAIVSDGLSARDALSKNFFDLVVLDVMLPRRVEDEPEAQTAIELLTELSETTNLIKPHHIIGLTAYEAAEVSVSSEFRDRSWVLVRQNSMNDDWMQTIASAVQYIAEQTRQVAPRSHLVDVVIITALESEMEAVRRIPWGWRADEVLDDCQFFARGAFESGGRECSAVAAVSTRMGMVPASILAGKMIKAFNPRLIAMPGICAGLRDKTRLGDVVCADMSWDYQSGKHVMVKNALDGFLMDPHFIQAEGFVSARVDQLARDEDFAISVWRGWNPKADAPPRVLRGPVASGSAVLADREITEGIRLQQRKLLAVDMELYGIFFAAEQCSRPSPAVLGMKSVCDFADEEKNDVAQPYAAYTSAAFLKEFCERFVVDLFPDKT